MAEDVQDTEAEMEAVDADEIYLLMKDDYRISRNTRATWYFQHLNTCLTVPPNRTLSDLVNDLEVVSIISKVAEASEAEPTSLLYRVTPTTSVTYLACRYKLAFVLDVSPSIASVEDDFVLFDHMFKSLSAAIRGVIKPFRAPSSNIVLTPQIYVTVLCHCSLTMCRANQQVLLQGCVITQDNVEGVLEQVKARLEDFENCAANSMADMLKDRYMLEQDDTQHQLTGGLFEDIVERPDSPSPDLYMMTPEICFINILRYGILALQLLPENCSSGIVVITDGIVGLPDTSLFESLMTQLRHNTISCSFIQLSSGFNLQGGVGHVPYPEVMHFIASATFGSSFGKVPQEEDIDSQEMNSLHKALLTWSFQKPLDMYSSEVVFDNRGSGLGEDSKEQAWCYRIPAYAGNEELRWSTPLLRRKHSEKNLNTPISAVISCRLREGYTIREIVFSKGDSQIEVRMVLPWRDGVGIHYKAVSAWPLSSAKRLTHTEVTIEACYDFLHDVSMSMKKPFKSPYRTAVVKKYWMTLQSMMETDQLLVHLQSFASNAAYYTIHECLKQGLPLFYMSPQSNSPLFNTQLSAKDQALNQFASFWKPVLMLDINIWQKWLHTHRIGLVLEHDTPLGKQLHIPNPSGRFHSITCRQSMASLSVCLRDWSTFVLMENHSYIKLVFDDPDKPPTSFYVLRIASKPPCLVLRLGFLGGTPGKLRHQEMKSLRSTLEGLNFPPRGTQKEGKEKLPRKPSTEEQKQPQPISTEHKPPIQRSWAEIPCCVLTSKPIEKILIRYERIPLSFTTLEIPPAIDQSGQLVHITTAHRAVANLFYTLSRYLHNQRWIWSVQYGSSVPISSQAIGRILANLAKIRLQEGFHFAHANSGVVNMVVEVSMKNSEEEVCGSEADDAEKGEIHPCVLQYIIFPPHTNMAKESISEEETEEPEAAEADGELQIITECWVEPQHGDIVNSTPERIHFDGLNYGQLAQAMYPTDLECISTMVTFEHLNLMCQSLSVQVPTLDSGTGRGTPLPPRQQLNGGQPYSSSLTSPEASSIQHVPFPFDLLRLLPKCQQVEMLFSTLVQDMEEVPVSKSRSNTLTTDNTDQSQSSPTATGPQTPSSPSSPGPNTLLFKLFLEGLKDAHDREIELTDFECEQLISLIKQRERNLEEHPLPFVFTNSQPKTAGLGKKTESNASLPQSTSTGPILSGQSQRGAHSGQPSGVSSRFTAAGPGTASSPSQQDQDLTGQGPSKRKQSILSKPEGSSHSPRWKCFIKSVTSTHIQICFVPASYDNLLLLTRDTSAKSASAPTTRSRHPTDDSRQGNVSGDSKVVHFSDRSRHSTGESTSRQREQSGDSSRSVDVTITSLPKVDIQGATTKNSLPANPATWTAETANSEPDYSAAQSSVKQTGAPPEGEPGISLPTECPEIPPGFRSHKLPVYIYNCPLDYLTQQLVNKWTFKRPPDIYEDLTFIKNDGSVAPEDSPRLAKVESEASIGGKEEKRMEEAYMTSRGRKHRVSECEKWRLLRDEDPSNYENDEDLKNYCDRISEIFSASFATGVFQSLQAGHTIDCNDIDAAINGICEEQPPLEIDLTKFLHCVCGHIRQMVDRTNLDRMTREDMLKAFPKSLNKEDSVAAQSETGTETTDSACLSQDLLFSLSLLDSRHPCEAHSGLHALIKLKFAEVLDNYFRQVCTSPDYYYFYSRSNHDTSQGREIGLSDFMEAGSTEDLEERAKPHISLSEDVDSDLFVSDQDDLDDKVNDLDSVMSIKDSMASIGEELEELARTHSEQPDEDEDEGTRPLFVNIMCSVWNKNCILKSLPLRSLPTCLKEFRDSLGEQTDIDLNDLRITLDIICLTLPPQSDQAEGATRPSYNRLTSYSSQVSYFSSSPPPSAGVESTTSISFPQSLGGFVSEHLKDLPVRQREAVTHCQEGIMWLLEDEIVSAMRLTVPVTADTLKMVAKHVQTSQDKPKCTLERVHLSFVYGSEQSLTLFREDFERMNLPGYHLSREGEYYYLYLDRASADFLKVARALEDLKSSSPIVAEAAGRSLRTAASVPVGLDRTDMQCDATEPLMVTASDTVGFKPLGGSTSEGGAAKVCPPGILKAGSRRTSEEDKKKESPVAETAKDAEPKTTKSQSDDNSSFEVLKDEVSPSVETAQEAVEEHGGDQGTFRPEDIRISVIRPSPVKEMVARNSDALAAEKSKGDMSQSTSTSSIQVLDEKEDFMRATVSKDNTWIESAEDTPNTEVEAQDAQRRGSKESSEESTSTPQRLSEGFTLSKQLSDLTLTLKETHSADGLLKSQQLNPNPPGFDTGDKKGMKRAHSSASFEFRSEKMEKMAGGVVTAQSKSGRNTPQRRQSGQQTPNRSRHQSGLQTPMSAFSLLDTSSRGSVGEEGYDGDSSDPDDDGAMMSFSEAMMHKTMVPEFWLIMKIHKSHDEDRQVSTSVQVFFHTRDTDQPEDKVSQQQMQLYYQIISNIQETCKVVNQKLLLQDLYSTRLCNKLLEAEADEDVKWTHDKLYSQIQRRKMQGSGSDTDSDQDATEDRYLAYTAETTTEKPPGHFSCPCVWKTEFSLHSRLKTGPSRDGTSRAFKALQSVLNKFSVNNRRNMYVISDNTGAVFYLRLEEIVTEVTSPPIQSSDSQMTAKMDEEPVYPSFSRSSSVSLPRRSGTFDQEDDSSSAFSPILRRPSVVSDLDVKIGGKYSRTEEKIALNVHGIGSVGDEIREDLVQMLQKKLDEAVLEIVTLMFARNPMCKLTPEDVKFMQKPGSQPQNKLQLLIPPCAMLHQYALRCYLRQNLLHFLLTPNYTDSKSGVFQDYTLPQPEPIADENIFLFCKPQQSGGKGRPFITTGLALIQLSLVDGKGNSVQLMTSPRPSADAHKDLFDQSTFDYMVGTAILNLDSTKAKGPGATALIQFNIWEVGVVGRLQLNEMLVRAVSHAACDVVTEYRLLTAPVCEIPPHYERGVDSPMHSAPPSPVSSFVADSTGSINQDSSKKPLTDPHGMRTPKERSSFSIQALMSDMFKSKSGAKLADPSGLSGSSGGSGGHSGQTWQEIEVQRRKEKELREKIEKYEKGERGVLHPVFSGLLMHWLDYCHEIESPAVQKLEWTLAGRYPMDYFLRDFMGSCHSICQDKELFARLFRKMDSVSGPDNSAAYVPYVLPRHPVQHQAGSESSLDLPQHHSTTLPGRPGYFIGVARNLRQWRDSIDYVCFDDDGIDMHGLTNPRTLKSFQKFNPVYPPSSSSSTSSCTEKTKAGTAPQERQDKKCSVPRQRLLLLSVGDKKLSLYTYNWAADISSNLSGHFSKLVQWHNSRAHLLTCIISQKMGLYQHHHFDTLQSAVQPSASDPSLLKLTSSEVDLLVKYTMPPINELLKRQKPGGLRVLFPYPALFDQLYRDKCPPTPMQRFKHGHLRDPIHRHGAQMLDLYSVHKREAEQTRKLQEVYVTWQQRGTTHMPISDKDLKLLRNSSRLIHTVATPLLFCPHWRKKLASRAESSHRRQDSSASVEATSRSRHSSGASIKSKRSEAVAHDGKRRPSGIDSPDISAKTHQEEAWHAELRHAFLREYIQYLQQCVQFVLVHIRGPSPKRRQGKNGDSDREKSRNSSGISPDKLEHTYLQKTLPGGIMLIELGFRDTFFFIKVYALECSRLPVGRNVNRQLAVIFTDECDKFKDLTHIHSFAHDFHLRMMQAHISCSSYIIFKQGYHIASFLQDFVRQFPYAPSFAQSLVYEGCITVSNTSSPGPQLFEFMLRYEKTYGMRTVRMVPHPDDLDMETDYALVMQKEHVVESADSDSTKPPSGAYCVGLIITHDAPSWPRYTDLDRTTLRLRYWVLLTSVGEIFPKDALEKKLRVSHSTKTKIFPAKASWPDSPTGGPLESTPPPPALPLPPAQKLPRRMSHHDITQTLATRQETVNYLGYSNTHQTTLYSMLVQQAHTAKEKIQSMVDSAMERCRRDSLWQRMLLGEAEEGVRRRHRTDHDDLRENVTRLSFAEFQELLNIVTKVQLSDIDPQLRAFQSLSLQWYQTLSRVLRTKYQDHHRFFSSVDNIIQHVVILNPNFLDTFMMLSVDNLSSKTELCVVYREPPQADDNNSRSPNLPQMATQSHMEKFVNSCCYHLWSGLLQ